MKKTGTLAIALFLGGTGIAAAGPGPGPMGDDGPGRGAMFEIDFAAIDGDGDGALTRAELVARATTAIAEIDADSNGVITRTELVAIMPAPPGAGLIRPFARNPAETRADRMLEWMDAVEAGQFEVAALAERQVNGLLAMLDADHDGAITQEEADGMRERFAERRREHHGRDDGHRPRRF